MRIKLTFVIVVMAILLALASTGTGKAREEPPQLDPQLQTELASWLEEHGKSPVDYVLGLFSNHDVVIIGEQHRIKHDVLFVQSLIKPLYDSGVRVLATEFGRREDQALIDSLLAAPQWNEDLGREITFRQYVFWGYQEYVDLYKAAWELNRNLPEGAPRFRILGIDDSPNWSLIKTSQDRNDPKVLKQVWSGSGEDRWAAVILDAVRSGRKVLVYSGIHHAFTKYRQPIVNKGKFERFDPNLRCGNHVYEAIGERAITVFLHAPWNGEEGYGAKMEHPADGVIDALMLAIGPRPVGFDLDAGPFGDLRPKGGVYRHGYSDFKLSDFCDGWIYTKPISEYKGVTPIPDWVNSDNLERARAQSPNPFFRNATVEVFNWSITRDAEIPRRWGHLR